MRYKLLGSSGLRVSEIRLGTMSFGDVWGFGADEKESHRILAAFAEAGGNFIDTANKYHEGQSEEIVGSFIGDERDRWVAGTKYTLATRSGTPTPLATRGRTCASRWRAACGDSAPTTSTCCGCMLGTTSLPSRRSCAGLTTSSPTARSITPPSPIPPLGVVASEHAGGAARAGARSWRFRPSTA